MFPASLEQRPASSTLFCCPFVARYGVALLSRWLVIQSSLVPVYATEATLGVPFPVKVVLDVWPPLYQYVVSRVL